MSNTINQFCPPLSSALPLSIPTSPPQPTGPPLSSMDSYIPTIPTDSVPIPFGDLVYSAIKNTVNPHPISITNPLQLQDFPETSQGAVTFQALTRVEELLSHSFHDPNDITPSCALWLGITSQLSITIHNSIRRTHDPDSLPHHFATLSPYEDSDFQTLASTISSLSSFFTNRQNDDSAPGSHEICLRCLEECKVPITETEWESVLLSCGQNIKAAHRTVINSKLRQLSEEMETWVSNARDHIKDAFINCVVNDDIPNFHDEHANDARLVEWVSRTKAAICQTALAYITNETILETIDPWASEALEGAKAHALVENNTFLLNYTRDQRALTKAKAILDANDFYTTTLTSLKAKALKRAEREVASFKSDLKIQAEERKEALRLDSIKWIKEPSSNSSITHTNRTKQRADPTAWPMCSRSISRSCAPSPESLIAAPVLISSRSPDQSTPQASPVVELPLNRALTEPALSLQPPPTNVTVGPPENSLEAVMLDVSMSQLPITHTNLPPAAESSFDPSTSGILSAIQGMITKAIRPLASQISVVSACCDSIQSQQAVISTDKPYSPSAPAALWAPNPSAWKQPEVSQQNSLPSYLNQPRINYDATIDEYDYNYTPHVHPDLLLVAQDVEHFYRQIYNVDPDSTLSTSQGTELRQFEDNIENYHMEWLSSDTGPLPWSDRIEYNFKQWRATILQARAFQSEDLRSKGATSMAQDAYAPPLPSPQPGSIKLFPNQPPSAPPITTINEQPAHQPMTNFSWSIMGKSGKPKSFAAAAAQSTKPANKAGKPPTSAPTVAIPGQPVHTLTQEQLTTLSHQEIINAFEIRFRSKVHSVTASKAVLINMYMRFATKDPYAGQVIPIGQADAYAARNTKPNQGRTKPRPMPVVTTDYTVTRSPSARALQGPKGDPAAIVHFLQTAIHQAFSNNNPLITLLSGRWSSQLFSNFVLTFLGTLSNDDVLKFSSTLCSPFGPGSSLVPQRGFTWVIVHSVPIVYSNGVRLDSKTLSAELARNEACVGLQVIQQPKWLRSTLTAEQTQSSILFAFLDEDGSRLKRLISQPVFLFGAPCAVKLFNSLPLIRQCDRCHALGHTIQFCRRPKNTIICPLCAGYHLAKDHGFKCANAKAHRTSLSCTCPPTCINCKAKGLKPVGHVARDLSCPLRKLFRHMDNHTGNSSEEDTL